MKRIVLSALVLVCIASCYYDKYYAIHPPLTTSTGCDTTNIKYSGQVQTVLNTYCISCHSTSNAANLGGGYVMDTYGDARHQAPLALNAMKGIGVPNPMPKGTAGLYFTDSCSYNVIKLWISKNYPQ